MAHGLKEYRTLDPNEVINNIERLSRRINERFPDAGLYKLAINLLSLARETKYRTEYISSPIYWVRTINVLLIAIIITGIIGTLYSIHLPETGFHFFEFIQILEAGINDVVLIGAGVFFLVTIESRIKRGRAVKALHELRSIAHVIDMLQLTKEPERILKRGKRTESSPEEAMTPFELSRYLDYCSEMLSLTGKLAALYGQDFNDSVALAAVNELEALTTGLSRKIWQKLVILHSYTSGQKSPV